MAAGANETQREGMSEQAPAGLPLWDEHVSAHATMLVIEVFKCDVHPCVQHSEHASGLMQV